VRRGGSARLRRVARAAALAALASGGCAGSADPVVDLTPWAWTWSQATLGELVIRYGYPDEPPPEPDEAAVFPELPFEAAAVQTRFAVHRYGCARDDRAERAACTVRLEFWLLQIDPPLADATPGSDEPRTRPRSGAGAPYERRVLRARVRDARGREWVAQSLVLPSGAGVAQYSRPIDARRALAVVSASSRAPDRVAARDLAREAIGRVLVEAGPPASR
jgi:hypothetical protein